MVGVGEEDLGLGLAELYDALGGNPWAAMPSLHFATSLHGGALARRSRQGRGARSAGATPAPSASPSSTSASTTSPILLAGAALVAAVRRGEPLAEPAVAGSSDGLQRLERIANG